MHCLVHFVNKLVHYYYLKSYSISGHASLLLRFLQHSINNRWRGNVKSFTSQKLRLLRAKTFHIWVGQKSNSPQMAVLRKERRQRPTWWFVYFVSPLTAKQCTSTLGNSNHSKVVVYLKENSKFKVNLNFPAIMQHCSAVILFENAETLKKNYVFILLLFLFSNYFSIFTRINDLKTKDLSDCVLITCCSFHASLLLSYVAVPGGN